MPDRARARHNAFSLPLACVLAACTLAACASSPTPISSVPASQPPPSTAPSPSATPRPTATAALTATPEPPLSLALPGEADRRMVIVSVEPDVPIDADGRIVVTVSNTSGERVTELVLRWPTELAEVLFLAPFEPAESRIADGGDPLVQPWTKWVVGPGERGEPAGTTSLGWGPLDPGATLTIPIVVVRLATEPVEFDLQLLAGEAILAMEGGVPAELRVSVP